jgi:uncharacterized protein
MLKNKRNKKILEMHPKFCKNNFSKGLGLMFSKKPKTLIFVFNKEKIISLHMFFVFYPIDVLFLNKNKKVVQLKENFKPFKIIIPKKPAKYIIELPNNTIKKTNTKIGDILSF